MSVTTLHFVSFLTLLVATNSNDIDDVKHCPDYEKHYLPLDLAKGMDSLTFNVSKAEIFKFNYSQCRMTPDNKFLIPDGVKVSVQTTKSKIEVDLIRYWENYKPLTRANTEFLRISGSFSADFQRAKQKIFDGNYIIRVDLRKPMYKLDWNTYKFAFNDDFETMLTNISDSVANGDDEHAKYYTDLLIHKFGTSYVKSVVIGGILAIEFVIPKQRINVSDYEELGNLMNVTKVFFAEYFNLTSELGENVKTCTNLTEFKKYEKFVFTDRDVTDGDKWKKSVEMRPAITDRLGYPLKNVASRPRRFNNSPKQLSNYLWKVLHEGVGRYYSYNTHYGCTTFLASNFVLGANHGDNNCHEDDFDIIKRFNFGGIYQTCEEVPNCNNFCGELLQKNILTGDYSCPHGFHKILLFTKMKQKTMKTKVLHNCAWNYNERYCLPTVSIVNVTYTTYWCTNKILNTTSATATTTAATFGGVFTSMSPNPVTGLNTCPIKYIIHKIDRDIRVCVGLQNETTDFVIFGGFFSNDNGNPMVNGKALVRACPKGYSQYLAYEEKNCGILYCMGKNYYQNSFPPLVSPVSDIFLRWEEATKETLMTAEGDSGQFYFRESTTSAWKFTSGLTEQISENGILRKLYESLLQSECEGPSSTPSNHGHPRYRVSMFLSCVVFVTIIIIT